MSGTTRSRINFFMNKFRKMGFIHYNGGLQIHSSLLNVVQPGLNLRVREVSDWTFKGKHTTTTAELIELEAGGFVVDTPGLRQFELWGVVPGELLQAPLVDARQKLDGVAVHGLPQVRIDANEQLVRHRRP